MNAMRIVLVVCYVLVSNVSILGAPAIPTAGLTLWLKADAGVTTNASGLVTTWQDQSTRSNDLSQGNAAYQPKLTNSALNGQPVIQFSDDVLSRIAVPGTNLFSNTAATVFIVQKQLGSDGRTTTLSWRTGNEQRFMIHATYDDSLALQIGHPSNGGSIGATQPPNWDDNWHLVTMRRNGTNGDIRVDGAGLIDPRVTYFTADGDNTQTADLHLGSDIWGNTFNGDIAEVIVYNSALTDADRNAVESYLRGKWSLPVAPAAVPDLLIKNSAEADAAFAANDVYLFTPAGSQVKSQAVTALGSAIFNVKLENDGAWAKPVKLRATESVASGWSVSYRLGASNITPAIVSANGFITTNLPPGTNLVINVEVTMTGIVAPGTNKTVTVMAYDDYITNIVRDAVQAVAVAAPGVQPDLLVRRDIDPNPIGDNIYNTTGAGQTSWQEAFTNQTATYLVTLANDGNTNMAVNLSFNPAFSPWLRSGGIRELLFDGADDYVDLGAWTPGTNWTIEAWVRPTSIPGGRRVIVGGMNECLDWSIAMQDGQFAIETKNPGGCTIAYPSGVAVTVSNWYHVTATCDGTNATLYVHGPLSSMGGVNPDAPVVVTGPVEPNYRGTASGTRIGGDICCGSDYFPGAIRDVRIWNYALGSNTIRSGVIFQRNGSEVGLVGLWLLDEGTGTRAFDLSPNRRHGTLANGPRWQPFDWPYAGPATNYLVAPGGFKEIAIAVRPPTGTAAGASLDLIVSANASGRQDAVRLVTTAIHPSATPVSASFTTSADFGKGLFIGTDNFTAPDQLQLSTNSSALPFLWVPNSDDGTVSKVNTLTGSEMARYRVCPTGVTGNPSRTTVDLRGSCWVANRNTATVVKIGLLENGDFLDRNGDGVVQTSRDLNGDGSITSDEMFAWGQDECVLHEVFLLPGNETNRVPGAYLGSYQNNYWNPGPRGLGVDAQGNLWCGTHDTMKYYYLSGTSGQILRTIDVAPSNHTAYGAVIDAQGILWSSGYKDSGAQNLLRLNPADGTFRTIPLDFHSYGIGLDRNNHLFVTGHQEARLTRWNVLTGTMDWSVTIGGNNRGVAITDDNDVWMASSSQGAVYRFSNEGVQKSVIPIGPTPTGVSVDAAGKVWVVGTGDQYIRRIDPATDTVDLTKLISGSGHYGYSDMTGILARNSTVRLGLWTVIHDSQATNTAWMRVNWTGTDATGTNILVRVRSSNNRASWSGWENVVNGAALLATPPGRFIEFEVTLRSLPGIAAPTLQDIAATGLAPATADLAVNLSASPNPVLSEHLTTCFVTVTNLSTNWAAGVWVTNAIPTGLDVLSISVPGGSYLRTNSQVICQMGGVGPRAATTISMVVEPQFAGSFTNFASVIAAGPDGNLANNTNSFVLTVSPTACAVPFSGLVAWWPGETNASDLIGTNNGALQGGVAFIPAEVGQGFTFDSDDDRVVVPRAPELNVQPSGFTVDFWMKGTRSQPQSLAAIVEKSHGWIDSSGWAIHGFPDSGKITFVIGAGGGGNGNFPGVSSLGEVLNGRWHHVAGTWDGYSIQLYVDGVLQGSTPLTWAVNNERPLNIGFAWGNGSPQRFFRGQVDELALYQRALSVAEITAIYEARDAGKCQSLFLSTEPILTDATVGQSYSGRILAALGTPPYTFTVLPGGSPPQGLNLGLDGIFTGAPTVDGTFNFTVRVTDSQSRSASRAFTLTSRRCAEPSYDMAAWWPGNGSGADLIGTNTGLFLGGLNTTAGEVGAAFSFNGADASVRVPASPDIDIGAADGLTIELWVKPGDLTQRPLLEWERVPAAYSFHLWSSVASLGGPGSIYANMMDTGNQTHNFWTPPNLLVAGAWQHVALTYDKWTGTARFYLNGTNVSTHVVGIFDPRTSTDLYLGNRPGSERFLGQMDEVTLHRRALGESEIAAVFAAQSAGKCRGPLLNTAPVLAEAVVGRAYRAQLSAALGTPPYTFSLLPGGNLPQQLSLGTNGMITGTPSETGAFQFTVQVRDAQNQVAARTFSLASHACVGPLAGMAARYPADGNGDDFVSTNHGTLGAGVYFVRGRSGQAFRFVEWDQSYVQLPDSPAWMPPTNQLSIEAWVRPDFTVLGNRVDTIIAKRDGCGTFSYHFGVMKGSSGMVGNLYFGMSGALGTSVFSTNTIPQDGQFHHVAITFDGNDATGNVTFYIDGAVAGVFNGQQQIPVTTWAPVLGRHGTCGYYSSASMDEIAFHHRRLSAGEIQSIYEARAASKCSAQPLDLLVKNASESDAAYAGQAIFESAPSAAQTKAQTTLPLASATYHVRIVNQETAARTFALRAKEDTNAFWTVTYSAGAQDVTTNLLGAGYTTALLPSGAAQIITVAVTPAVRVPGGTTKTVTIQAVMDTRAQTVRDTAQLVTTAAQTFQPDLSVRRETDVNFLGEGVINNTGAGQTKAIEVDAGGTATYRVTLRNSGNVTNRFALTGPGGGGGWDVRYYGAQSALQFDGGDDYVDLGNWFDYQTFTLSMWVKPGPAQVDNADILDNNHRGGINWVVQQAGSQQNLYDVGISDGTATPQLALTANTWQHVAVTRDASRLKRVYLNGQLIGSSSGTQDIPYPDWRTLSIARWGGGGRNWNGAMSDLHMWNRALNDQEVQADVQGLLPPTNPGVTGYWPLSDGSGTVAHDLSANLRHGTLVNGPAWTTLFDNVSPRSDITDAVTGSGWTNIVLAPGGSAEFVLIVSPNGGVPGGSVKEILVTGTSLGGASPPDAVKAVTTVSPTSTVPVGGNYTTSDDFANNFQESGVDYSTVPGQLQLSTNSATLPFVWVPNNEGTLSKVDSRTGRELARYRTCPPNVNGQPSRTTVDLMGNCWVVNRYAGTVIKVGLLESGVYIDRNGNGQADTSRDLNNDGDITGAELLPWGQDECVLFEVMLSPGTENTYVPGTYAGSYYNDWGYPGPRGVAVDSSGNCWVGTLETKKFYYLDGTSGAILRTIDVSPINHRSYGAVLDRNGILWASSHDRNWVLRLDPATGTFTNILLGHFSYGINADRNNHVFVSGWQDTRLTRLNALSGAIEKSVTGIYESRGIAITDDNDVWVANSGPGTVARWSNDGTLKAQIPAGNQPTGVAVDAAGKVWVLGLGDPYIRRIDPAYNTVDLTKQILCGNNGGYHYGYSDMTGTVSRNATTRIGTWSVVHNARVVNTPWGIVFWAAETPPGTSLKVRVRSTNNRTVWSTWETVFNGTPLHSTPPGKYLEVEVTFQSTDPAVTPALQELRIQPAASASYGTLVYSNSFETVIGPEWSTNTVGVTPNGGRHFLGQFGNQTATLALSNLAPHAAVTVMADVYAIRSWDGNDTTEGPDIFELNVAGGLKLVHSTFNNGPADSVASGQAYPDQHPLGVNPARTGAAETNSLGFTMAGAGVMDSVYRLTYSLPHSSDWLVLNFLASGLNTNLTEESWGLDNVRVYLTPREGPPKLVPVQYLPGGFTLELRGEPGWNYVIQGSPDLVNWSGLVTNRISTNVIQFTDPSPGSRGQRFYRALQLP